MRVNLDKPCIFMYSIEDLTRLSFFQKANIGLICFSGGRERALHVHVLLGQQLLDGLRRALWHPQRGARAQHAAEE